MSAVVGGHAECNPRLLAMLAGTWETSCSIHVHSKQGIANSVALHARCEGPTLRAVYEPVPGGIAGGYSLATTPVGKEATTNCILGATLHHSDDGLIVHFGEDDAAHGLKGAWSGSCIQFRDDYHDGFVMWEIFQVMKSQITSRPSTISVIIHQVSESGWLLDVSFWVQQLYPAQTKPVNLQCRLEFWHLRERPDNSPLPLPHQLEEFGGSLLRRCEDVTQDVEFRIEQIDGFIASLEDCRSKCEEQLQLLKQLKSSAEASKDIAEALGDDLEEAVLAFHEEASRPADSPALAGGPADALARIWSELSELQADTESYDAELDSVDTSVEFPEELIGSAWTHAEYARGQRLLRANGARLPPPKLTFLGSLEAAVSNLSKAAIKIAETTAVLVQLALEGEVLEEPDCGPQIASMSKLCERILDDIFMEKRDAFERDSAVAALLADERSWQYRIPIEVSKVSFRRSHERGEDGEKIHRHKYSY